MTAAGAIGEQVFADLKPAPAAVFFDKSEWAHRGRVLAALTQAALERGVTSGGDFVVLLVIARKVLGLSLSPEGALNAQSIARATGYTDRAVRAILMRLAGLLLIHLERDGKDIVRCRVHPGIFEAARDGAFAARPVDSSASVQAGG